MRVKTNCIAANPAKCGMRTSEAASFVLTAVGDAVGVTTDSVRDEIGKSFLAHSLAYSLSTACAPLCSSVSGAAPTMQSMHCAKLFPFASVQRHLKSVPHLDCTESADAHVETHAGGIRVALMSPRGTINPDAGGTDNGNTGASASTSDGIPAHRASNLISVTV